MIKILFFIDKFGYNGSIGGAEKVLITLVNHMNPKKFDITVQTLYPDEYAELLNPYIKYKFCYPKKSSFSNNLFRVEAQLGLTYPLHIKGDYDIEVAYLDAETTKIMAASTNEKAKKIAWVHCDFEVAVKDKELFINKTVNMYRKFDKIACVSEKCKESFISMFGNNPEVVVIHNVIDDKEILDKAKQPIPEDVLKQKMTLCTVGNLTPPKNHIRLLSSVRKLHEDGFDFDLWIVGDGQQRPTVEKYIRDNQMDSYVTLVGFQKNPYTFMREADILVCSSNYEGLSTFISEGLILGKPIVTTDCSGMNELLGDSEYGMITPNEDNAFYQGIKGMLSKDSNQLQHYSEKSLERGKMFSADYLTEYTEKFFEDIYNCKE